MEGALIESYCRQIHFWRLVKKPLEPQSKFLNRLDLMNTLLIKEFLKLSRKVNANVHRDVKHYLNELKFILPNVRVAKDGFVSMMSSFFDRIRVVVSDAYFTAACLILGEMKQNFRYVEKVPKIFKSDLILDHTESLFKEKLLKSEEFSDHVLVSYIVEEFSEYFEVDKKEFQSFVKSTVEEQFFSAENKIKASHSDISGEIEEYLKGLIDRNDVVVIEIQILKILETESTENAYWESVYQSQCFKEQVNLLQVLKISEQNVLILIKFEEFSKTLILSLENYINKPVKKLTSHQFDQIVPGSKPEALFIYSNSLRKFWKCILTETKLIIKEELGVYEKYQQPLLATYFIRHQNRIIYVYQAGGVTDFSLKNGDNLNYADVYPQRYTKLMVSECERFIFLISNNSFCIFNSTMKVITFQKIVPVYLLFIEDSLKILLRNNEEFEYKTFSFRGNHLGTAPSTDLKIDKVKFLTQVTLDFGKSLIKGMISPNKFENLNTKPKD